MHIARNLTGAALLLACAAPALAAQSRQRLSLQVSGLYAKPFGGDYETFKVGNGIGTEAQLRYTPGVFSIGAGFQYTSHNAPSYLLVLDDESRVDVTGVGVKLFGAFVEPRMVIPTGSDRVAPYLSARMSLLHYSNAANWAFQGQPYAGKMSSNTSGLTANGGGGLLVRMTPRVNMDLGATYGFSSFGKYRIKVSEQSGVSSQQNTSKGGSGSNLVVRVGLAVGIGG
jgi:hypothetical protein